MCTVSMIMDHYGDRWQQILRDPYRQDHPYRVTWPTTASPTYPTPPTAPMVSRDEVEEFRKLLERAREYDKRHSEPDCELAEKKERVLRLAKDLGVEISFL